jgi:PmbA protein
MHELKQRAQEVARLAASGGATAADVMIREDNTFSVAVRMGEVETLKEAISRSLLLRIFVGKRTATSNTSDLSPATIQKLVLETIEMAKLTSEDESGGLPEPSLFQDRFPDLDLVDPGWDAIAPGDRIDFARRAEKAAFDFDSAIVNSEGGYFDYSRSKTVLANTLGFMGAYEGTSAALAVTPIAQSNNGMQRDYWFSVARHRAELGSPEEIGRKAAERALRRVGARKVATCEVPIVLDPLTARTLAGDVFSAVAGDAVYRRSSFLVDQIGQTVASPAVTIVDDARLPRGLGSAPFDDEGIPTRSTSIIDAGVLQNYLHSSYSARKLNASPTGNGQRVSSGSVIIGPTNFYLKAGQHSPEDIIASTKAGLFVVELIGSGVNHVSGDYSRGAVGIWIENGKLAYPVHEVTIAGNLREMLKDVEIVGNDLTFFGSVSAPTIKIRKMVVSGE